MLFDLRARGRRRAIKVIYASLALLMGGGLVLFGIGGEVQGGLVDGIFGDGSSSGEGDDVLKDRLEAAEKRAAASPTDAAAWAAVARLRYQTSTSGDGYDENTGQFTEEGKDDLRQTAAAWERHVKLSDGKPNADLANVMVQVYGALGQNEKAVSAFEVVVESKEPNENLYANLALLAYQAGQTRKGDLARTRALDLAPKDQREALKSQLDAAKSSAAGQGTTTTPSG